MFAALGRFAYRRRRLVVALWLALFFLGLVAGSAVFGRLVNGGGSPSSEAVRGREVVSDVRTSGERMVALVDGVAVTDPAVQRSVTSAVRDLRRLPHVAEVVDAYTVSDPGLRAADGSASIVIVGLENDLDGDAKDETVEAVERRLRAIDAPTVKVGGDAVLHRELGEKAESDLQRGEKIALPIALVVLLFVFGGILAAGLPIIGALAAISGGLLLLLGASHVIDLSSEVVQVTTVMGLGLAIDYCLLIVNRFREERAAGADVPTAVEQTAATAGRTVAFSALTVAVALAGLFVFEEPSYRSIGSAGVGVVLVALAMALTLIPALLSMWGPRMKVAAAPVSDDGFFARMTRRSQRHPVPIIVGVVLFTVLSAVPFLDVNLEFGGSNLLPKSSETRQVDEAVNERFPTRGSDPITIAARTAADGPALAGYLSALRARPDVVDARVADGSGAEWSIIHLTPRGTSQGDTATGLVEDLRADRPEFRTLVTGDAAYLVDFNAEMDRKLPWALTFIAVTTFVLLFLMTGSVLVPIKAILMNVLSLGASFGALVWIFQDGHGAGLLDFTSTGAIEAWLPMIVFTFAFGLSMDYEVFLLARIKELYDQGYDNAGAVAVGLQRTGRIITSAALLIIVVFAGFASGEMLGIKQVGVAMAIAVFVDATLIRTLLVPATMSLLGDLNWWAPGPLRRLHDRIGLSEAPSLPQRELEAAGDRR